MKHFRLHRRAFLRGAGATGIAIALPPLESISRKKPSFVHSAAAAEANPAGRFILCQFGTTGAPMADWTPSLNLADDTQWRSPILDALRDDSAGIDMRNRVNIVTGLSNHAISSQVDANRHATATASFTTGKKALFKRDNDPKNKFGILVTGASGPSIDQVIAAKIGSTTRFSSLVLSASPNAAIHHGLCAYRGANEAISPYSDPLELYNLLFSDIGTGDGQAAAQAFARNQSILNYVKGQIDSLQKVCSNSDCQRLDQHFTAISELERQLQPLALSCEKPTRPVISGEKIKDWSTYPARVDAFIDMIVMALKCDLTRVINFSITLGDTKYPFLSHSGSPLKGKDHNYSHVAIEQDSEGRAKYAEITRWKIRQFAKLLHRLEQMPEGNGSLLDHCAVTCVSPLDDGQLHADKSLPVLAAGGLGGMSTGHHLVQPCVVRKPQRTQYGEPPTCLITSNGSPDQVTPISRLWLTAARALGLPPSSLSNFGDANSKTIDRLWV